MVANKFDSRIIVDGVGAGKLLGRGNMLFSAAWNPFPVRIQAAGNTSHLAARGSHGSCGGLGFG